jgi:hypothetical protein
MKTAEIQIGKTYLVRLHGKFTRVRIDKTVSYGKGWTGTNLKTGREVRIRSAAKLRKELSASPAPAAAQTAKKRGAEEAVIVKRDIIRHKDGSVTYSLPVDRRKFVANTDAEQEVTLPAGKMPRFVCCACGSIDPKVHAASCTIVMSAHQMKTNFWKYTSDVSLWCIAVSGHDASDKVRCVLHETHDGVHGFPTSLSAQEHQRRLGAVPDAEKRERKVLMTDTPRSARVPREPGVPRAPRGDSAALMGKTIKVLEKKNPRREGTALHGLYEKLKDGETVAKYMERSGAAIGVVLKCISKKWIEVA